MTDQPDPIVSFIWGLWPQTKPGGGSYATGSTLTPHLGSMLADEARKVDAVQWQAMLTEMRRRNDKFPGLNTLLSRLESLQDRDQRRQSSRFVDQRWLDMLVSRTHITVWRGPDDPYARYWCERCARCVIDVCHGKGFGDGESGHVASMGFPPKPKVGDYHFGNSHDAGPTVRPFEQLLFSTANILTAIGRDAVTFKHNGKPILAGMRDENGPLTGSGRHVRKWTAADIAIAGYDRDSSGHYENAMLAAISRN